MASEQRIIKFRGNVQGVGFRYTTCRIANGYDVTGFVRNCPDGTVECVVEGERNEINAFLAELTDQMGYYVRDRNEQSAPASGSYHQFGVRF